MADHLGGCGRHACSRRRCRPFGRCGGGHLQDHSRRCRVLGAGLAPSGDGWPDLGAERTAVPPRSHQPPHRQRRQGGAAGTAVQPLPGLGARILRPEPHRRRADVPCRRRGAPGGVLRPLSAADDSGGLGADLYIRLHGSHRFPYRARFPGLCSADPGAAKPVPPVDPKQQHGPPGRLRGPGRRLP